MSRLDKSIADVAYILDTLMAYRNIVESGCCNNCINAKSCKYLPELGQLVRYNCPFYKQEDERDIPILEAAISALEAQPERKTGRWLIREGISDAQCSECKMYFRDVYDMDNSDSFCRHCGAKMDGLKVVEDE